MISRSPYRPLEKILGYRFRDRSLLEAALTHPSWRHEKGESARAEADNQRLEFLGDAALGLVAAHSLFTTHPDAAEGDLTRLRAQLVSTKNLAQVARQLGLGPWLRLGKGEENNGGRDRDSNLADVVEALLGAAFLDGGLKAASPLFAHWFLSDAPPQLGEGSDHENAKGALQEKLQQSGLGIGIRLRPVSIVSA